MIGQGQPQYKRYGAGDRESWWINLLKALGGGDASKIERMLEDERFESSRQSEPNPDAMESYLAMSPEGKEYLKRKSLQSAAEKQAVSGVPTVVPTSATKKYVTTPEGKKWVDQGRGFDEEAYVPYNIKADIMAGGSGGSYYPEGGFQQEEILDMFKGMNPNLDMDKVAEQVRAKGGNPNVPGGTLSVMPDTRPYEQSDEAYMQWVKDFTYEQELGRKMDPRSRAYDPQGAELLMNERAQQESNAAQMIYSLAQQQRAQAEMENVDLVRRQMMLQSSPQGQVGTLIGALMDSTDPTIDQPTRQALRDAMVLNALGKTDEAMEILRQLEQAGAGAVATANKTGSPQVLG